MSTAQQFLRFAAVGATATGVQYVVLIVLKELVGVPPIPAAIAGFAVGAVANYLLNRTFTFGTRPTSPYGPAKFAAMAVIGAGINTAIFAFLLSHGLYYLLAQAIASVVVLMWSYAGSRYIVFR